MIAQLIAFLEFPIVLSLNLNGIVCQMNHHVQILNIELMRTRSNVPMRKPIKFAVISNKNTKQKGPNIEFSTTIKQKVRFVSLDYCCAIQRISSFYGLLYLVKRTTYKYISSSIRILSRFYNPQVIGLLFFELKYLLKVSKFHRFFRSDVISMRNDVKKLINIHFLEINLPALKQLI